MKQLCGLGDYFVQCFCLALFISSGALGKKEREKKKKKQDGWPWLSSRM